MIQARAEAVVLPPWPVFGLVAAGGPGWLCGVGVGENDGTVHSLRVDYRRPGVPERVIVQTQPAGKRLPDLGSIRRQVGAIDDEGEPLDLQEYAAPSDQRSPLPSVRAQVLVADEPVPAEMAREGGNSAWRVTLDHVAVVVAARNVVLDRVELRRIDDLAPFKRERKSVVRDYLAAGQPYPPGPYSHWLGR